MRVSTLWCFALLVLGCGGGAGGGDSLVGPGPDAGGGGVEERCVAIRVPGTGGPVDLGALGLDGQDDVSTSYSFGLAPLFGTKESPDYLVVQFYNYNERIGPLAVGTFPLDQAPNDNFGTCPECIAVWVDQTNLQQPPAKLLLQSAGSIRLDVDPRSLRLKGRIEGLVLREVTIDPLTNSSTFVPDGDCAWLTGPVDLDFKWVPLIWRCAKAAYNAGDGCDCGCGAIDPDCYDADGEQVAEFTGCADGQACHLGDCRDRCSVFAPQRACASGFCLIDWPDDLCSNGTSPVDPAAIGEPCTLPGAFACAAAPTGIMAGACSSNDEEPVCRAICRRHSDCASDEACWVLYSGLGLDQGKGYCAPGVSALWLCDPAFWRDGATCDCGCGDLDPDCDVASRPLRGCGAGEVCDAQANCVAR